MLHHLAEGKAVIQQHMINCFNFMQCVDFCCVQAIFSLHFGVRRGTLGRGGGCLCNCIT